MDHRCISIKQIVVRQGLTLEVAERLRQESAELQASYKTLRTEDFLRNEDLFFVVLP